LWAKYQRLQQSALSAIPVVVAPKTSD